MIFDSILGVFRKNAYGMVSGTHYYWCPLPCTSLSMLRKSTLNIAAIVILSKPQFWKFHYSSETFNDHQLSTRQTKLLSPEKPLLQHQLHLRLLHHLFPHLIGFIYDALNSQKPLSFFLIFVNTTLVTWRALPLLLLFKIQVRISSSPVALYWGPNSMSSTRLQRPQGQGLNFVPV